MYFFIFASCEPVKPYQFTISGVTGRGRLPPPPPAWPANFCWSIGKKEARKKWERGKKEKNRRKIVKGKVRNWKWKEGKIQNEERTFFFFLLFTFQNDENLFWVYQNGNFLPGKRISCREKNQENDFSPSEKISCYALVYNTQINHNEMKKHFNYMLKTCYFSRSHFYYPVYVRFAT